MKKSFFSMIPILLFFFCSLISAISFFNLKNIYFESLLDKFNSQDLGLFLDYQSKIFIFMVFLVTLVVVSYSEVYMDFYNMKKFFYLTFLFFISMIFLSLGGSFLILMIGWDGLGISSLCLIMFYPSKISMYNSFLTFFFNRLGDLVLMLMFVWILFEPSCLFYLSSMDIYLFSCLILICSFTKSAQLPFSSWLPAAMSAPTPISAMVHSSTLVTAGIFLIWKTFIFLFMSDLIYLVMIISLLTFLAGGLLANLEWDLKKMVAFSTMSQISMIIYFISLTLLVISFAHMFFHALFKTLLFCSCGFIFLWSLSDQQSKSSSWVKSQENLMVMIYVSIFSMSGLIFSASFYSKDLVLENLVCNNYFFSFFCLIWGSILTIFYSSCIFSTAITSSNMAFNKILMMKCSFFFFGSLFTFLTLLVTLFSHDFFMLEFFPMVGFYQVLLILILISSPFFFNLEKLKSNFSYFSVEILFSKIFAFSIWSKFLALDYKSFTFNDQLFFKPNLILFNTIYMENLKKLMLYFFFIFGLILIFII